ncbi:MULTISPECIES: hypothetical protein [Paenibacillus]|uniref:hypothetical protein n=1 Tax=Paenibacillus TaxID=44249 RepID=UPI002FDF56BD
MNRELTKKRGLNVKDADLQEFFNPNDWGQEIPANLQQFSGQFADLACHAGKTCRFAGFFNFRPKRGKKPADLQEF